MVSLLSQWKRREGGREGGRGEGELVGDLPLAPFPLIIFNEDLRVFPHLFNRSSPPLPLPSFHSSLAILSFINSFRVTHRSKKHSLHRSINSLRNLIICVRTILKLIYYRNLLEYYLIRLLWSSFCLAIQFWIHRITLFVHLFYLCRFWSVKNRERDWRDERRKWIREGDSRNGGRHIGNTFMYTKIIAL